MMDSRQEPLTRRALADRYVRRRGDRGGACKGWWRPAGQATAGTASDGRKEPLEQETQHAPAETRRARRPAPGNAQRPRRERANRSRGPACPAAGLPVVPLLIAACVVAIVAALIYARQPGQQDRHGPRRLAEGPAGRRARTSPASTTRRTRAPTASSHTQRRPAALSLPARVIPICTAAQLDAGTISEPAVLHQQPADLRAALQHADALQGPREPGAEGEPASTTWSTAASSSGTTPTTRHVIDAAQGRS